MYYLKIKTKYNTVELLVENYYDESVQELIQQPYVESVYLRWFDAQEKQQNQEFQKVKKFNAKARDE